MTNVNQVHVISVPYDSALRDTRMGRGPSHLLDAGLADALRRAGATVRITTIEPPAGVFPSEIRVALELQRVLARHVAESRATGEFPLVVAGNCNTALGTVAGLMHAGGSAPLVCWLDAHADFNTPETSSSGFLDGMAVAMLTGRCWTALTRQLRAFAPIPESRIIMIGARDLDPAEEQLLASSAIRRGVAGDAGQLEAALWSIAPEPRDAYLHLDLDVFDPSEGRANEYAAPHGLRRDDFHDLLARVRRRFPISAAALTAYDPSCDADHRIATLAIEAALSIAGGRD